MDDTGIGSCSTAFEAALATEGDSSLVLSGIGGEGSGAVLDLAAENIADQFAELNRIAWALKALFGHVGNMP